VSGNTRGDNPPHPGDNRGLHRKIAGHTIEERDEMTDTQGVWLTQESHDRLKAELDQLIANRPVIAAEINDRREEGDLRENGGYHAARDQQGQEEARIRQLQELLNTAKVGEAPKQKDVALPGSVVEVEFTYADGSTEKEKFLIATRQEGAGHEKLEVYSPNSPLGAALLNAKKNDVREYKVPSGKTVKVKLLNAEPYHA
jgi:transcription elongation factor GreA